VEWLATLDYSAFPAWGIVTLTVILILTGKLRWHADARELRDANAKLLEANTLLVKQNVELAQAATTSATALKAKLKDGDS